MLTHSIFTHETVPLFSNVESFAFQTLAMWTRGSRPHFKTVDLLGKSLLRLFYCLCLAGKQLMKYHVISFIHISFLSPSMLREVIFLKGYSQATEQRRCRYCFVFFTRFILMEHPFWRVSSTLRSNNSGGFMCGQVLFLGLLVELFAFGFYWGWNL